MTLPSLLHDPNFADDDFLDVGLGHHVVQLALHLALHELQLRVAQVLDARHPHHLDDCLPQPRLEASLASAKCPWTSVPTVANSLKLTFHIWASSGSTETLKLPTSTSTTFSDFDECDSSAWPPRPPGLLRGSGGVSLGQQERGSDGWQDHHAGNNRDQLDAFSAQQRFLRRRWGRRRLGCRWCGGSRCLCHGEPSLFAVPRRAIGCRGARPAARAGAGSVRWAAEYRTESEIGQHVLISGENPSGSASRCIMEAKRDQIRAVPTRNPYNKRQSTAGRKMAALGCQSQTKESQLHAAL